MMRAATAWLLPLLWLGLAGCEDKRPADLAGYRQPLKQHVSDKLRARGFFVEHTDEDPEARGPTKWTDAVRGLAFTLRHAAKFEERPVTLVTWVYVSHKARDAAKQQFAEIAEERRKANVLFKWWAADGGDLHALCLIESPSPALVNQFDFVKGDLESGLEAVRPEAK